MFNDIYMKLTELANDIRLLFSKIATICKGWPFHYCDGQGGGGGEYEKVIKNPTANHYPYHSNSFVGFLKKKFKKKTTTIPVHAYHAYRNKTPFQSKN